MTHVYVGSLPDDAESHHHCTTEMAEEDAVLETAKGRHTGTPAEKAKAPGRNNPPTHTKTRVRCQIIGRAGTDRSQAAQPRTEERPLTYGFELFGSTSEQQAAASLPSDTGDPSSSLLLETTLGSIRNDFDCQR